MSLPEDLTAAVQSRAGLGKFSQYVTDAVTRQLEQDLLAELSELLTAEHGPVPEEYLAEARAPGPTASSGDRDPGSGQRRAGQTGVG